MKTAVLLIVLCIAPIMAIPPVNSRPRGHVISRFHFLKIRPRSTTTTTTTTTTTEPTTTFAPEPRYTPTEEDVQRIALCYFDRNWERVQKNRTPQEQQCYRLSTNQPNYAESHEEKHIFRELLLVWHKLSKAIVIREYNVTADVREEIQRCYFSRQWNGRKEHKRTRHDNFCKRLATDKPNVIEVGWLNSFKEYRKVWLSMPEVASYDFKQLESCSSVDKTKLDNRPECIWFRQRVKDPRNFREARLRELYECTHYYATPNEYKDPYCVKLRELYLKHYYKLNEFKKPDRKDIMKAIDLLSQE